MRMGRMAMSVPRPDAAKKPPSTAELYPLPLSTHIGPLPATDRNGRRAPLHRGRDSRGNRCEEKGVFVASGEDAVANDLTGIVDASGHG